MSLKRMIGFIVLMGWGTAWAATGPAWQSGPAGLPEAGIQRLTPLQSGRALLVATSRALYRFSFEDQIWKKTVSVRTSDALVDLIQDPAQESILWLATRRTVRRSLDQGRSWKIVFRRDSESGSQFRSLYPEGERSVLVGTTEGLFRLTLPEEKWTAVESAPKNSSVDAIAPLKDGWMISTSKGIYRADAAFGHWTLLDAAIRSEAQVETDTLNQFAIEEIATAPIMPRPVTWSGDGRLYFGKKDGLYEAMPGASSLAKLEGAHGFAIRQMAVDERFVYLATDRGVYRLTPADHAVVNISEGLGSLDVASVAVDASSGTLWAGTRSGLFRMETFVPSPAPTLTIEAPPTEGAPFVLASSEPTIQEIQQAAIRYAEVSPEKIQGWRDAAARRAWLPSVSLDTDLGRNQNVDLDRGGTNDPDLFIMGPEEKSIDWSVGVSWDLGDLIWNDDQTSIDSRSRLMVELRNDILNDVTHLYFERRRAQMELAALPAGVPKLRLEKQFKLEELTAQIDALTGGFLSRSLAEHGREAR